MGDTYDRLVGIVGKDKVIEKPDFNSSSVGFRPLNEPMAPDYLVKPADTEQVQQVVKLANELGLSLVPVSSGGPHRSGGTCPDAPGTIIVDLSGMNKVLKINRRHRLALIQPGVTWEQLAEALDAEGLRIPQPLLPKKGKSVIATLLDREPLLSPKYQWNMTEPLRSMEIIFGTGDKIHSGMGYHRGDKDEAWESGEIPVTNAGPHQFDFLKMLTASQGTFGIVTWASVRVEAAAKDEKAVFVEGESVEELSDYLYKNLQFRFGDEVCLLSRKAMASILADDSADIPEYEQKLAMWTAFINVKWGALRAKEKIRVQAEDIDSVAQENGLVTHPSIAGLPVDEVTGKLLAVSSEENWKEKAGDSKEIFFLSTLDRIPAQLKAAADAANRTGYSMSDCAVYIQPLHQGAAVNCHIVLPMPIDEETYADMGRDLMREGAFFSRPYGIWSDMVYDSNAQNTILTKKMKDIFDPMNILNPGKLCF